MSDDILGGYVCQIPSLLVLSRLDSSAKQNLEVEDVLGFYFSNMHFNNRQLPDQYNPSYLHSIKINK